MNRIKHKITSHYFNQISSVDMLYNGKFSFYDQVYKDGYQGVYYWNVPNKENGWQPYGVQISHMSASFDNKSINHYLEKGKLSTRFDWIGNIKSSYVHEKWHLNSKNRTGLKADYKELRELDAYWQQINHDSWSQTSSKFKQFIANNTADYFYDIINWGIEWQNMMMPYLENFQDQLGGYYDFNGNKPTFYFYEIEN